MFEQFEKFFCRDEPTAHGPFNIDPAASGESVDVSPILQRFFDEIGGASFGNGIYRTLAIAEVPEMRQRITMLFNGYSDRALPIAFDWMNRIYCADLARVSEGEPKILIFSHLTDEVIEIPALLVAFHNIDLVNFSDELLDATMFGDFRHAEGRHQLGYSECASTKHPLFLGGEYDVVNFEIADTDVDWSITSQLLLQVREMDEGTLIDKVNL